MNRWKCLSCGAVFTVQKGQQPNMCCNCGEKIIVSSGKAKMNDYDSRLNTLAPMMNDRFDQLEPMKKEYYAIMQYFRTQLHRGNITEQEYQQRASMFHGYKTRGPSARMREK